MRFVVIFIGALLASSASAQTQLDLNQDACAEYQKADAGSEAFASQILRPAANRSAGRPARSTD